MKTKDIVIRDPFVLAEDGKYYMYGTRSLTCWGEADGFDVYVSDDLENWSDAIEVFHKPADFPYDKNYWAPEVHKYNGAYYMFATFCSAKTDRHGTMILKSEAPCGPFKPHSKGTLTPDGWNSLDGTFYVSPDGKPYMIFSHEWVDIFDGEICAAELNAELTETVGEPFTLFKASEASGWVRPIKHRNFPDREIYVTDGPFAHRCPDGSLALMWSSFGEKGYVEAVAFSDNGDVTGKWTQAEKPVYAENGGHGMLFNTKDGRLMLALHCPNTNFEEHPVFIEMREEDLMK